MIEGCYLEVSARLEPARHLDPVRRMALPRESAGLRHSGRPDRARLPPLRPEVAGLQRLDERSSRASARCGRQYSWPSIYVLSVGPIGLVMRLLRPRPPGPEPPLRAVLLADPRAEPARSRGRRPAPVLMSTYVLGISCFYHDSAAALLKDGEIVAACQEERLSRKKHDSDFPARAVKYVLQGGGHRPRAARRGGLLRQAAPEVRAHALDLHRDLPALVRLVPQGDPAVAPREALGAVASSARSSGPTRGRSSSPSTT